MLIGSANPCNVFWQVGSSATLGTTSTFLGTILALTSITATTGATVNGRLLARNGAVTLDSNPVTDLCAAQTPGPTTTTTTSTTSTTVTPTSSIAAGGSIGVPQGNVPAGSSSSTGSGSPALPRTGSSSLRLAELGVVAVASGAVALIVAAQARPSRSLTPGR